ncbi:MCE family protein [Gordonia sp. NB41Y]|uniref:MCE family protein n=1 Tax=Gordonia sp. NB41Y TaxID=875808 RepID=UPI0002BDC276|nr:MCE family protein [Gordonia sp. NB41Y]EMP15090.1 mammalian cell entry protein [Gordonia sp. NB41Y]WLP92057.1 MCE family protein [Gordonia sp. NB41Y]
MATVRRRLLGIAFLVVVALFFTLTIMKFNKSFTDFTTVTLTTDAIGNALPANADVKARGVVVGEVRSVEPSPDGTVDVELGLNPSMAAQLPTSTTARILPKTLFGERYVDLQVPTNGGPGLSDGDTIVTDKSGNAKEVQELFDKLLPVLQAIPPQDLNVTLTALSSALQGRGEKLGATVEDLNTIFSKVDDNMSALQGTVRGLASFSQTYSEALPDVIDALDNLRITTNTINERQNDFRTLISTVGVAATDTTGWLQRNGDNLVDLFVDSEQLLTGLAKQSPTFVCTFRNFATLIPESKNIVGVGTPNPGVRVNLQFVNPRGRYLPNQDEPRFFDLDPPAVCYEPATDGRPFPQYPGGGLADGSYQPPSRNAGPRNVKTLPQPQFTTTPVGTITSSPYDDPNYRTQLKVIYGSTTGTRPADVPTWVTMIGGPALSKAEVHIQ